MWLAYIRSLHQGKFNQVKFYETFKKTNIDSILAGPRRAHVRPALRGRPSQVPLRRVRQALLQRLPPPVPPQRPARSKAGGEGTTLIRRAAFCGSPVSCSLGHGICFGFGLTRCGRHMRMVPKVAKCNICGFVSRGGIRNLRKHVRTRHAEGGEGSGKRFQCSHCSM